MQKYSSKFLSKLNNYDILNQCQLGFEFEFYSNVSYYKTLELLNNYLDPIKVAGYRVYHSGKPTAPELFKLEPDYSGGPNMAELITHYLPYSEAMIVWRKIMFWLEKHTKTTDRCSMHVSISFPELQLSNMNTLKLIIATDESYILDPFEDRENIIYAQSIKNLIPYYALDYSDTSPANINAQINREKTKYSGINFSRLFDQGRLEWRYIGGKDYHLRRPEIEERIDYFIFNTYDALVNPMTSDEMNNLQYYLDEKVDGFRTLSSYDNFIAIHPTIDLRVDRNNQYEVVMSYYERIYPQLFEVLQTCSDIQDGIINWDSSTSTMELVDFNIRTIKILEEVSLINCDIKDSNLNGCTVVDCDIRKTIFDSCEIYGSELGDSRIEDCRVDRTCLIKNSFFSGGEFDGEMESGVFRSGKIGKNAFLGSKVQIISDENFFMIDSKKLTQPKMKKSGK